MDRHLFRNLLFSRKEASYENKAKLAQRPEEKLFENVNGRIDRRSDEDKRSIIIARPEHSSSKLKRRQFFTESRFDISCILSPMEAICMKCQVLFSDFHEMTNPVFWEI